MSFVNPNPLLVPILAPLRLTGTPTGNSAALLLLHEALMNLEFKSSKPASFPSSLPERNVVDQTLESPARPPQVCSSGATLPEPLEVRIADAQDTSPRHDLGSLKANPRDDVGAPRVPTSRECEAEIKKEEEGDRGRELPSPLITAPENSLQHGKELELNREDPSSGVQDLDSIPAACDVLLPLQEISVESNGQQPD